jgi:hypothetical protein
MQVKYKNVGTGKYIQKHWRIQKPLPADAKILASGKT